LVGVDKQVTGRGSTLGFFSNVDGPLVDGRQFFAPGHRQKASAVPSILIQHTRSLPGERITCVVPSGASDQSAIGLAGSWTLIANTSTGSGPKCGWVKVTATAHHYLT
ncbi:hypothetical protein, partial [Pseudomonas syringae group genomosp. 3]|uniref:hypothetical protein n=1 Tax=Pseudomonas syringae group genomosp. 3 TaxID=251701 RepID=UPI001C9D97B3